LTIEAPDKTVWNDVSRREVTMRKLVVLAMIVAVLVVVLAPAAFATIHPLVESFDCANQAAFEHHPLGDVADPPGQTPGFGSHSEKSSLRAISAVTKGFTDFSSPALLGHKLDGECGNQP
jgi:hypothetical protein